MPATLGTTLAIVTAKSPLTPRDFCVNGKGFGKEAEMTAGPSPYIASAAADPGPGGSVNAFSSLTTLGFPCCLLLIFTSDYSSEPTRMGTAQTLVTQCS